MKHKKRTAGLLLLAALTSLLLGGCSCPTEASLLFELLFRTEAAAGAADEETSSGTVLTTVPETPSATVPPTVPETPSVTVPPTVPETTSATNPPTAPPTVRETTPPATVPVTVTTVPPVTTVHVHSWVPVTERVRIEAETSVVHHEAEYESVRVTDREAWEETVEVSPAWDEEVTEVHTVCNECGFDFTAHAESGVTPAVHSREHVLAGGFGGWHTEAVTVGVIHHEAEYRTVHHEAEWHTEERLLHEAWDETVVLREAYEEETVTGYRCAECGAEK